MKKIIPVLLASLLAVQIASAGLTPVELGGIRPVDARASNFSKVKYKIETGPGAEEPEGPPNLTTEQRTAMYEFLDLYKNIPEDFIGRMDAVLTKIDMYYKRPITKAEWDQRIQKMQDEFVKKKEQPGAVAQRIQEMRDEFVRKNGHLGVAKSAEEWEKEIDEMLGGFVKKLGDPHTVYMDRAEAQRYVADMQGNFVGVGARVEKVADGVKLEIVFPDSPAEKSGLVDGDVVTAIDGVATKDQDLETIIGRLRGSAGTQVKVRVTRLGQPVTVVRGAVQMPDLFGKMAAPGIGYVYFSQFVCKNDQDPTSCVDYRLFKKIDALRAAGAKKLIIDLRDNGGGRISVAESIGSEFLQDKDVITMTKRQGQLATKAITDGPGKYSDMRLAIIVNGDSASASEMLSAGLQEHGKAIVIGSVSYGKGSFQRPVPIGDGTMVKITGGGWYTPKDRSVQGVYDPATDRNIPASGGVKPDEAVTMTEDEERAAMKSILLQLHGRPADAVKDAALDKAIEVLQRP